MHTLRCASPYANTEDSTSKTVGCSTGVHKICRIPAAGGDWEPLPNDNLGRSHGPYADLDGEHVWFHSTVAGRTNIYKMPLQRGDPVRVDPPGFRIATHATRARNDVITFDARCQLQ